MVPRKPNRRSGVILTDVIAPAGFLRLAAYRAAAIGCLTGAAKELLGGMR
jgi:hypothetical protein